jgi:hypothetical protein
MPVKIFFNTIEPSRTSAGLQAMGIAQMAACGLA